MTAAGRSCDKSGGDKIGTTWGDSQGVDARTGVGEGGRSTVGWRGWDDKAMISSGKPDSDARDTMSSSRDW